MAKNTYSSASAKKNVKKMAEIKSPLHQSNKPTDQGEKESTPEQPVGDQKETSEHNTANKNLSAKEATIANSQTTSKEKEVMTSTENMPEVTEAVRVAPTPEIEAIIRKRTYAAMTVGLVPVPALDLAALTGVQVELLYRLAKAYNVPFKKEWGKKAIGIILSVALPGFFTPTIGNLVRYIPLVGTGLSVVSWPLTLGATTYALGVAFAKHFASGGDFLNCDLSKIGEQVKEGYSKGVDKVKGWTQKDSKEATATAE